MDMVVTDCSHIYTLEASNQTKFSYAFCTQMMAISLSLMLIEKGSHSDLSILT